MSTHNELGKQGEQLAVRYLQKNGYQILEKNWRFERAEVDIICKEANTVIFVEVKTRATSFFGHPEEAVHNKKQEKLIEAAEEYIVQNNFDGEVRFDVISIILDNNRPKVYHIPDAFF